MTTPEGPRENDQWYRQSCSTARGAGPHSHISTAVRVEICRESDSAAGENDYSPLC